MAALIQDEQLTEHSIRENYDDGDDETSFFDLYFQQNPSKEKWYIFTIFVKSCAKCRWFFKLIRNEYAKVFAYF